MADTPRQLEDKYEILEKLSEGGMGAVYRVRHRFLDDVRVIKLIRPHLEGDSEFQARFVREARLAAKLQHANVIRLLDFSFCNDGTAYMILEFIDGIAVDELLRRVHRPPLALALEIAAQSLEALGYLHDKGLVHRDVSPDNLMITTSSEDELLVKLLDLGIARNLENATESRLTKTGSFLGKVRYASPEHFMAEDATPLDRRSDLYSFGVVFYELLTGRYPIRGKSPSAILAGHLHFPPIDFLESDPEELVPSELRAIVLATLEKKPADRPPEADTILEMLRPLQERFPPDHAALRKLVATAGARGPIAGQEAAETETPPTIVVGEPPEEARSPTESFKIPASAGPSGWSGHPILKAGLAALALLLILAFTFRFLSGGSTSLPGSGESAAIAGVAGIQPVSSEATPSPANSSDNIVSPAGGPASRDDATASGKVLVPQGLAAESDEAPPTGRSEEGQSGPLPTPEEDAVSGRAARGTTSPSTPRTKPPVDGSRATIPAPGSTKEDPIRRAAPTSPENAAEFRHAVKIHAPPVQYPEEARQARREGRVVVEAQIGLDGSVIDARVVSGVSPELDEAARAAVKAWRFQPATLGGKPVEDTYRTAINYELVRKGISEPLEVGGDVLAPERLVAPSPVYTDEAREAGIQGLVVLRVMIDEYGNVQEVKVTKGLSHGLTESAVDAVRQWQFKPATLHGEPVAVSHILALRFQ